MIRISDYITDQFAWWENRRMPSTSEKQKRTMQAAAHNPAFAAKMKIPQKVARDFEAADKATGRVKPAPKKRK